MARIEHNDVAETLDYLADLADAMIRCGEAIDIVRLRLHEAAESLGLGQVEMLVLPTAFLIQHGDVGARQSRLVSVTSGPLRLDQVGGVYELVTDTIGGSVGTAVGRARLEALLADRPTYGPVVRTLGLGVLSVGFALSLQPTPFGVAVALVLGIVVGLLNLIAVTDLKPAVPVLAAFIVSAAVFALAEVYDGENPVRSLIPPLVIFLPGAMITTGTSELAAGQMIAGASRLVAGMVALMLLAIGIVAGATIVGASSFQLVDRPPTQLGAWAPWVALLVITLGNHLYHCAPRRALPWILLVLVVAYTGQTLGARVFNAEISGFFGALAMTPVVLAIGRSRLGIPSMVLFLPAFWLLVPGAAGLLDITQLVGTDDTVSAGGFISTLVTVMSISMGVLLGSAVMNSGFRLVTTKRLVNPG